MICCCSKWTENVCIVSRFYRTRWIAPFDRNVGKRARAERKTRVARGGHERAAASRKRNEIHRYTYRTYTRNAKNKKGFIDRTDVQLYTRPTGANNNSIDNTAFSGRAYPQHTHTPCTITPLLLFNILLRTQWPQRASCRDVCWFSRTCGRCRYARLRQPPPPPPNSRTARTGSACSTTRSYGRKTRRKWAPGSSIRWNSATVSNAWSCAAARLAATCSCSKKK